MLVIDPTIGIERPRAAAYRPATLDSSALTERLRGMMGCVHEATHILSAALGLRPGEAYALEWRDIDWREGRVTVNKTLQQVKGKLYVYPTKTAKGDRVLYLPKWAKVRLHAIWTAQSRPKGRIIGDATPVSVSGVIKRYAAKHGLPAVTMQNLRHTWATLAMEAGVAIETIAMNLGHSSLDMAYAHYMTPRKGVLVDAQKAVSKLLGM
jgi:integrase